MKRKSPNKCKKTKENTLWIIRNKHSHRHSDTHSQLMSMHAFLHSGVWLHYHSRYKHILWAHTQTHAHSHMHTHTHPQTHACACAHTHNLKEEFPCEVGELFGVVLFALVEGVEGELWQEDHASLFMLPPFRMQLVGVQVAQAPHTFLQSLQAGVALEVHTHFSQKEFKQKNYTGDQYHWYFQLAALDWSHRS